MSTASLPGRVARWRERGLPADFLICQPPECPSVASTGAHLTPMNLHTVWRSEGHGGAAFIPRTTAFREGLLLYRLTPRRVSAPRGAGAPLLVRHDGSMAAGNAQAPDVRGRTPGGGLEGAFAPNAAFLEADGCFCSRWRFRVSALGVRHICRPVGSGRSCSAQLLKSDTRPLSISLAVTAGSSPLAAISFP